MRLLLDECVPKRLKRELLGHEVKTVQDMGWAGIKNGALLKLADGQFDALLTVDQASSISKIFSVSPSALLSCLLPATTLTTCARSCLGLNRRWQACGLGKSCEWVANLQMEPTRPMPVRSFRCGARLI